MILPKSKIRSIAEDKLALIGDAKKCLADFLPYVSHDEDVEKLARHKIAECFFRSHNRLIEYAWDSFQRTDQYKIAKKLVEIGKFNNLRDAVDFVCD